MAKPQSVDDFDQRAMIDLLDGPTKEATADGPMPPPGVSTAMPVTPKPQAQFQPPSAPSASVFQGFTPKHAMEGFDFNREQNTGKSAKDAFAYLANQAPPPPINDKGALGAWFTQYIAPGMNALGHNVSNVEGDKFRLNNWQGQFDVDYGRGAGADGGALAWQVDDGTAQMPANASYQPNLGGIKPAVQAGAQKESSAIDRILQEIAALQQGGPSPMDQQALMELL